MKRKEGVQFSEKGGGCTTPPIGKEKIYRKMVWIFGVYAPNSTLCVSLMKIGEKKWAVNFRRPESKKLQVSESAHTEK